MPDGATVTVIVLVADLAAWATRFKPAGTHWSQDDVIADVEDRIIAALHASPAGDGLLRVQQIGHTRWRTL